ncbi:MAG: FtsW/RodA/SpoVE family cell cycle protein [Clostridiales bacterium]|nr:FtsW/RodA/SpoVE family cell cycle protein [Clostridiales bacterium]
MEALTTAVSSVGLYFTTGIRWVFLLLAILILVRQIRSLLRAKNPSEIWAYLGCPDDSSVPLTHWENLMGRGRGCDIILNLKSVSRTHGLLIRDSKGVWKYKDLNSKNGSAINGMKVKGPTELKAGDILTIGGSDFTLYPVSLQERMSNIEKRKQRTHPVSPWPTLFAITLFQFFTVIQFRVSLGENFPAMLPVAFLLLCALMWAYVIFMRTFKRVGFEMEMIAFFLSTLSLAVTTSAYPDTVFKQAVCICLGVALFFGLCWLLRDLNRAKRLMYILMGLSIALLLANLVLGTIKYGAQNWISIGGFSFQPSELVKIVFIYIGAATLDELQQRKNLTIFLAFSVFCLGCLAIMGDFGTAIIFFVTFLIISFLRSGDFTKLILIVGAAGLMGMMVLRFKPYIATRFDTWGHVWDVPTEGGFQQVQTMTSAASGGLLGLGAGEGNLSDVAASSTDLVFGLLCEEWGLIVAILSVLCIITLGVFAVRAIIAGRSTYYSIAACGATSMFIFQTILNVFGSVDLLPLTGVTFPFVSSGGTSMIASWGMLAFLKAADTRQNASFAIRLDKKDEFENEMESRGPENPEDLFDAVGYEKGYEDGYWKSYEDSRQEYENSRQKRNSDYYDNDDEPLTLDDLFGGDKK